MNSYECLGLWEKLNNPLFNPLEFEGYLKQAGSNAFTFSPQKVIANLESYNAILISKGMNQEGDADKIQG